MTRSPSTPGILAIAAAIAIGLGTLGVLWVFARALALFVLAVTLASALSPLVCRLDRRMPRMASVVLLYLTLFGGIAAVSYFVVPSFSSDLSRLGTQLPEIADRISRAANRVLPVGGAAVSSAMQQLVPRIVSLSSSAASAAVDVLIVVFLSLYFLLAAPAFHSSAVRLFPHRQRRRVSRVLNKTASEMGGYFRGAVLNGAVVGGLTWLALFVVGLDYAVPLAILAFFGELVPYLGPVIAAIPAVGIALLESTSLAITIVVIYVAIQQIEGHVLTPLIMHSQTHISPALVIVALTMGYTAGGILGALTAIPLFAAGRVVVRHIIGPALRHRSLSTPNRDRRAA